MAHHKRRRHKNARAGCRMCKGWYKGNGSKGTRGARSRQELRSERAEREFRLEVTLLGARLVWD